MIKKWDEQKRHNFEVLSNKMKFIPRTKDHEWYFEMDLKNLYFDELAFMIEYLQAIGEMRFRVNIGQERDHVI